MIMRGFAGARSGRASWTLLLFAGLLLLVVSCGSETPPEPAPATARTIAQGELVGLIAANGAHVWRGVPFAASTGGENRWRAPRPAPPWEGVRDATRFAERCPQLTNRLDEDEGLGPGLVIGSEDCLALDVYAPPDARGGSRPVMVWIHGGGNVWGRSSAYDASRLAANEDVVVVAVQYRLGPLGWFAHEALRAGAERPEDAAAAFAILDLVAALRWVRDHVAAFGGDPRNVTVFGESAGGHNVVGLLASPHAEGLFHRAIVHSGSFDSVSLAEAEGRAGELLNPSGDVARRLGASTAAELRAVSLEDLFGAYVDDGEGFLDVPRAIQDGVALPAGTLRDALRDRSTFHAVPTILGTNRDEMKLFYFGDERLTRRRFGFFVVPRDPRTYDTVTDAISRLWRIRSVDEPAAAMVRAGHAAVYSYRFDWDDGGRLLFMDFKQLLGAAHGFEIPFVFNRFHHLGPADAILFQDETLADRERLSRAMGSYWASFARDGVPRHAGTPEWTPYGTESAFLRLDTDNDGGIELAQGEDTLDALLADLNTDLTLDDEQRCFIINEMTTWMLSRGIHDRLRTETNCP